MHSPVYESAANLSVQRLALIANQPQFDEMAAQPQVKGES
jgi:hypothetical protein